MAGDLGDGREVFDAAEAALVEVSHACGDGRRSVAIVDRLMRDGLATPRVCTIGLSRRSLERLTAPTDGATPKLPAAKYLALMGAAQIAVGIAD